MRKRNACDTNATNYQNGGGGPPAKKQKRNNNQQQQQQNTSNSSAEDSPSSAASLSRSECEGSPKPEFLLSRKVVNGAILTDIAQKKWRIGKPVGKGSFGEIFLASDKIESPVTSGNARYVVKMEPHSNGPLFVEIHCLLNTGKNTDDDQLSPGMPEYIASGSHYFKKTRYRFLVLPRFDRDLHSIIKHRRVDPKSILILAVQILDALEHLHDKGYCHSDIKAENLMISKCTYNKKINKYPRKSSAGTKKKYQEDEDYDNNDDEDSEHNEEDSETDGNEDDVDDDDWVEEELEDEEEKDANEDEEEASEDDEEEYYTPMKKRPPTKNVQYSGSNPVSDNNSLRLIANNGGRRINARTPNKAGKDIKTSQKIPLKVRSCRTNKKRNSIYQEMVKSHYLRPTKKINYSAFFDENSNGGSEANDTLDDYIKHRRRTAAIMTAAALTTNAHSAAKSNDSQYKVVTEDRIFLIDFGLASKFVDPKGAHRPFCMDQRRAHDGTLEFTSRDAHMGAHSRRSDLECLGYNLIYWSQGYLPWKMYAAQQQHDRVHWMKEYLMRDVKEMLQHIYGKSVPKYLGEFMQYVGELAYCDRPDYNRCKRIFYREFTKMGYKPEQMVLDVNELSTKVMDLKDELENNNIFEEKNIKSIMKNLGVILPFRESNSNRVSPKNLRSKSDKLTNKKRSKFSWAEILSQDPDQIARERAEKEFDREQTDDTPLHRFSGKPTYAILAIQNRLKFRDRLNDAEVEQSDIEQSDVLTKGHNKPMMEVMKKRQAQILIECKDKQKQTVAAVDAAGELQTCRSHLPKLANKQRSKSGLRTVIKPTKRALEYSRSLAAGARRGKRPYKNSGDFTTDESSCSSLNSVTSSKKSQYSTSTSVSVTRRAVGGRGAVNGGNSRGSASNSSSSSNSVNSSAATSSTASSSRPSSSVGLSDEDTRDTAIIVFSPKRTRMAANKNKRIMNGVGKTAAGGQIVKATATVVAPIVSPNKRKRSIPRKRNAKGEIMRYV